MTEIEFKRLKEKINSLKMKSAESTGKMAAIRENWKRKYGFDSLEDAVKKLEELESEKKIKEERRNSLMEKLQNSFEWEKY